MLMIDRKLLALLWQNFSNMAVTVKFCISLALIWQQQLVTLLRTVLSKIWHFLSVLFSAKFIGK